MLRTMYFDRAPVKRKNWPAAVSLVFLAALILTTCNMDILDSLQMPANIPYASISGEGEGVQRFEIYRFTLTWKFQDGLIPATPDYNSDAAKAQIKQVRAEWERFKKLIEPRAHYTNTKADGTSDFNVWVTGGKGTVLDNTSSSKDLKLGRCWPRAVLDVNPDPRRTDWINSKAARIAEFKQTVKGFRKMIDELGQSPLLDVKVLLEGETGEGTARLREVYNEMKDYIAFPSNPETHVYEDRPAFDQNPGGILDASQSGILHEYYFGYAPKREDYEVSNGKVVFPVDDNDN